MGVVLMDAMLQLVEVPDLHYKILNPDNTKPLISN